MTGAVENDPLSLAPFLATGAIAARARADPRADQDQEDHALLAAAGFAIGIPYGHAHRPAGRRLRRQRVHRGDLGRDPRLQRARGAAANSTLRRVLLYGPAGDRRATPSPQRAFRSRRGIRRGSTLRTSTASAPRATTRCACSQPCNSPGALAPLLALSLLCYLTIRPITSCSPSPCGGARVALSLTLVRSSWIRADHRRAGSRRRLPRRQRRLVLGSGGGDRGGHAGVRAGEHHGQRRGQPVRDDRQPRRRPLRQRPLGDRLEDSAEGGPSRRSGHGSAARASRRSSTATPTLRVPDNGYLSLIYQVGAIGFLLVHRGAGDHAARRVAALAPRTRPGPAAAAVHDVRVHAVPVACRRSALRQQRGDLLVHRRAGPGLPARSWQGQAVGHRRPPSSAAGAARRPRNRTPPGDGRSPETRHSAARQAPVVLTHRPPEARVAEQLHNASARAAESPGETLRAAPVETRLPRPPRGRR